MIYRFQWQKLIVLYFQFPSQSDLPLLFATQLLEKPEIIKKLFEYQEKR